jgi:hypothetical protein
MGVFEVRVGQLAARQRSTRATPSSRLKVVDDATWTSRQQRNYPNLIWKTPIFQTARTGAG